MQTLRTDQIIYVMSRENVPAARIKSGETLCFETLDCYSGQIRSTDASMAECRFNPATGPVFIEEARPGDILKVEILGIDLSAQGVMVDGPNSGITGRAVTERRVKLLPIRDGFIHFHESLHIPVQPMIGVIGTAPEGEGIDTGTPGPHGGNMDCSQIGIGATLYLPVQVEGALLALGDLHARMGDGEVAVCAVETGGRVTARITVIKNCDLPTLFLVKDDIAAAIFSGNTLEEAGEGATMAMHRFLARELGLDAHDAGMLLSIVGNLRICQVVDPLMTCRMEIPVSIAAAQGYTFP